MTVRISSAEARRLGIKAPGGDGRVGCPPVPIRSPRRPRWPYRTRCVACDEEFTTIADESRHLDTTTHRRFELVIHRQEGTPQ